MPKYYHSRQKFMTKVPQKSSKWEYVYLDHNVHEDYVIQYIALGQCERRNIPSSSEVASIVEGSQTLSALCLTNRASLKLAEIKLYFKMKFS